MQEKYRTYLGDILARMKTNTLCNMSKTVDRNSVSMFSRPLTLFVNK